MHHIRLFGGAVVSSSGETATGRSITGARLALVSLLAIPSSRPVSRERLMAMLWPEADGERARHLLRDTLYRVRDLLGPEAIVGRADDLQLDPSVCTCDVWTFEEATLRKDWAAADRWYGGPLLDGLFPVSTASFESWLESERQRLSALQARCLEALADECASRADWSEAVNYRRRLTTLDPYNGRYALGLMRVLEAAGDRAGALRHAEAQARLLADDLAAVPDPDVDAYAEQLRHAPARDMRRMVFSTPATAAASTNEQTTAIPDGTALERRDSDERPPEFLSNAPQRMPAPSRSATATVTRRLVFAVAGIAAIVMVTVLRDRTASGPGDGTTPTLGDVVPRGATGTTDAVAWEHYLRGRHYMSQRGASQLLLALDAFRQATRRDPSFARGHAGAAEAMTLLTLYDGSRFSKDTLLPAALDAARRATRLDADLGEAHAALGQTLAYLGRRHEAEVAYRRAIALDSTNATTRQWFAELLVAEGRVDESIAELERALALDPSSAINHAVAANHYRMAGRFTQALQHGERAVQLDPTLPAVWEFYARALYFAGLRDSAARIFARHSPQHPFNAYIRARGGDGRVQDSVRRVVERWQDGSTPMNGTVGLAVASLAADNGRAALRVLEEAQARNPAFPLHNALIDQIYDPIRGTPAFRDIVRRAGLSESLNVMPRRSGTEIAVAVDHSVPVRVDERAGAPRR